MKSPYCYRSVDSSHNGSVPVVNNNNSVVYVPSVIAMHLGIVDEKSHMIKKVESDVTLLLKEKDVQKRYGRAVSDYLENLLSTVGRKSLPDGVTDEQLMSKIRSRYIQTPSELAAYLNQTESEMKQVVRDTLQKKAAEVAAQKSAEQSQVNQPASPSE